MTSERLLAFQYWHDGSPPPDAREVMETWRQDPAFDWQLFDQERATAFIEEHFDADTLRAFRLCAVPAMQADLFRYAALFVHGGVYADVGVKNLAAAGLFAQCDRGQLFLRGVDEAPAAAGLRPGRVINGIMFVRRPGDPLMDHAVRTATSNVLSRLSNNVWEVTGPGVLTAPYSRGGAAFDPLFAGFEIQSVESAHEAIRPVWLPYKSGPTDWRRHLDRSAFSIFRDPPADEPSEPAGRARSSRRPLGVVRAVVGRLVRYRSRSATK